MKRDYEKNENNEINEKYRIFRYVGNLSRPRLLAFVSAIIGLALFIYVINRTGLNEIRMRVNSLGAGFLLILAVSSIRYLSRSFAWLRCMAPGDRKVGFWSLWRARVA